MGRSAALLKPLADALGVHVMAASKLHADDTPVSVPSPSLAACAPRRAASESTSTTALRLGRPARRLLSLQPDRKDERPQAHLEPFTGVPQADAYAGFGELHREIRIAEAACWSRTRRKIYDVHTATASPIAEAAQRRCRRRRRAPSHHLHHDRDRPPSGVNPCAGLIDVIARIADHPARKLNDACPGPERRAERTHHQTVTNGLEHLPFDLARSLWW